MSVPQVVQYPTGCGCQYLKIVQCPTGCGCQCLKIHITIYNKVVHMVTKLDSYLSPGKSRIFSDKTIQLTVISLFQTSMPY